VSFTGYYFYRPLLRHTPEEIDSTPETITASGLIAVVRSVYGWVCVSEINFQQIHYGQEAH